LPILKSVEKEQYNSPFKPDKLSFDDVRREDLNSSPSISPKKISSTPKLKPCREGLKQSVKIMDPHN